MRVCTEISKALHCSSSDLRLAFHFHYAYEISGHRTDTNLYFLVCLYLCIVTLFTWYFALERNFYSFTYPAYSCYSVTLIQYLAMY